MQHTPWRRAAEPLQHVALGRIVQTVAMNGYGAVRSGTDLAAHARTLRRVHDAVLSGDATAERARPVVLRSWERVMSSGIRADALNNRSPLGRAALEARRERTPLRLVLDDLAAALADAGDESGHLMVVADADGVVLWRRGSSSVRRHGDRLGFVEGAPWTEQVVGTNAIGTALAERAPVQLFSAEHFEEGQHPWFCTASPIHDPRTGELLGVVDVSGPALSMHPALTALVSTAVRVGELRLHQLHAERLSRLATAHAAVLAGVRAAHVLVDADGWVAAARGVHAPTRLAAPAPGAAVEVPGLGWCTAEELGDGYLLVAPDEAPRGEQRVVLRLGDRPVLEADDQGEGRRIPLSPRHGAILAVLARTGAGGLTAHELGRAVYGEAVNDVTVRAEVSRLRRVVGALVESSPYRLRAGVRLDVVDERPTG